MFICLAPTGPTLPNLIIYKYWSFASALKLPKSVCKSQNRKCLSYKIENMCVINKIGNICVSHKIVIHTGTNRGGLTHIWNIFFDGPYFHHMGLNINSALPYQCFFMLKYFRLKRKNYMICIFSVIQIFCCLQIMW